METRIVEVNTTAFSEENMMLITNLTSKQILKTLRPVVLSERDGTGDYDNETLVEILRDKYPNHVVDMYYDDTIEKISI